MSDPTGPDPHLEPPGDEAPSARATVKRQPDRARYDREAVHAVLDEGLVAHVGIEVDGQPYVLPMVYARDGERLLLHGSVASRVVRGLAQGIPVCVTVTLLDGLVMARSAFHHSMNYRSVMVLGTARKVDDPAAAAAGFSRMVEHVAPGRSAEVRAPNDVEARQTVLLAVPIVEASVKSRSGGPIEDPVDLEQPSWGGVVPVTVAFGPPTADADTPETAVPPASLVGYGRPATGAGRG